MSSDRHDAPSNCAITISACACTCGKKKDDGARRARRARGARVIKHKCTDVLSVGCKHAAWPYRPRPASRSFCGLFVPRATGAPPVGIAQSKTHVAKNVHGALDDVVECCQRHAAGHGASGGAAADITSQSPPDRDTTKPIARRSSWWRCSFTRSACRVDAGARATDAGGRRHHHGRYRRRFQLICCCRTVCAGKGTFAGDCYRLAIAGTLMLTYLFCLDRIILCARLTCILFNSLKFPPPSYAVSH